MMARTCSGEVAATVAADLEALCPGGLRRDVPLSALSRWGIGGIADLVVQPASLEQLRGLRARLYRSGIPHLVIGETSNLLFADEGLRAVCIQIGRRLSGISIGENAFAAEAGAWVPLLARQAMKAGLTGAEHICGIPGSLGGLICMNGGSQRKRIGSAIVSVTSVDEKGSAVTRAPEACGFGYRTSVFQSNGEIVAGAVLRFEPHPDRGAVRREMLAILASRRRKFPRRQPNCGSVFKSDPAMYADYGPPGAIIERLGYKGLRRGGAEVSPVHANFIVNRGGARAEDVLALVDDIRATVLRETGYDMEPEVRLVRPDGVVVPAGATGTGTHGASAVNAVRGGPGFAA